MTTKVLTNSLAATDEPAVHAGYAHYRRALLSGGVQLYELRPLPGAAQTSTAYGTSSGVSLHAKSAVVDRHYVFIGSMNMDQRSKLLNTEMGVIVDSPGLAGAVADFFDRATAPANAFQVELKNDPPLGMHMVWVDQENGATHTFDHEPGASVHRRLEVMVLRMLPIDGLL